MSVTIELDFTGHTPAGAGIGYLETGHHTAKIVEFRHYDDSNRLLVYMLTNGIRHKDSFSLTEKAMPFLMGFLVSAGIPESKLSGKVKFPFSKLVGKTVYISYTAATMGPNNKPVEGSYPDYRYLQENYFNQIQQASGAPAPADFKVEETSAPTTNGASKSAPSSPTPVTVEAAGSGEDFEFLM